MQIEGRTVLVTGANRGIGKSIVEELVRRGASTVYAGARNVDTLKPLIDAHGDVVKPIQLDVTNPSDIIAGRSCPRCKACRTSARASRSLTTSSCSRFNSFVSRWMENRQSTLVSLISSPKTGPATASAIRTGFEPPSSFKKCSNAPLKSGNLVVANLTIGPGSPRSVNRANRMLVAPMSTTTDDRSLSLFLTFIYQDSECATGGL